MGLDMYLNAKRFIGWRRESELASKVTEQFPELQGSSRRVKEVIVEAMYWRKSNQIHAWFVENCQNGTDDCGYYRVSREQLEELRQLILQVLDNKDASRLPPQAGFFFGSSEVNAYYWDDLRRTEAELNKLMAELDVNWDFEYHSSW